MRKICYPFSDQDYHKTTNGKNCVLDDIVTTEAECKVAIARLGIQYQSSSPWFIRPAGCFYHGNRGYFNQLTDPSATNPPDDLSDMGGVCQGKGISLLNMPFTFVLVYDYAWQKSFEFFINPFFGSSGSLRVE